jgi:hypothetical protein
VLQVRLIHFNLPFLCLTWNWESVKLMRQMPHIPSRKTVACVLIRIVNEPRHEKHAGQLPLKEFAILFNCEKSYVGSSWNIESFLGCLHFNLHTMPTLLCILRFHCLSKCGSDMQVCVKTKFHCSLHPCIRFYD